MSYLGTARLTPAASNIDTLAYRYDNPPEYDTRHLRLLNPMTMDGLGFSWPARFMTPAPAAPSTPPPSKAGLPVLFTRLGIRTAPVRPGLLSPPRRIFTPGPTLSPAIQAQAPEPVPVVHMPGTVPTPPIQSYSIAASNDYPSGGVAVRTGTSPAQAQQVSPGDDQGYAMQPAQAGQLLKWVLIGGGVALLAGMATGLRRRR